MPSFKAIFFDAGNTLIHTSMTRFERIHKALAARGFQLPQEHVEEAILHVEATLLGPDKPWIGTPEQEARFWDEYFRILVDTLDLEKADRNLASQLLEETYWVKWSAAYPETHQVLRELRGHYKLGVISNAFPSMEEALIHTGVAPFMDSITLSAYVGVSKPEPRIYEVALQSLGVAPRESLFVDDVEENVQAAVALGFTALLIDRTGQQEGERVIHDLKGVLEFLKLSTSLEACE